MCLNVHSLDFSDDSVSTTTGRPSAWTIRYSAPEVLESEPRNRASDIFSLGCVLIEMVSGLHGHSLSKVKDHWKGTSNGQSSFARNPEATSSWLKLLPDHPASGRLKPIVDFLPELLVTTRLDRPSAEKVVDRLRNLSLLLPEAPHLVNTCCGPPSGWIDNLHPERVGGSGLPRSRDPKLWSDLRSYFDAVADNGMTYIVLDQRCKQVAAKHECYSCTWHNPYHAWRLPYIANESAIKDTCDMLFFKSDKTRLRLDPSQVQNVTSIMLDLDHVLPQVLEAYTSWQVIFTALSAKVLIPDIQRPQPALFTKLSDVWRTRTIQISMVGHGRYPDDDRYFRYVFYVLAFKIFEEGYMPSQLGASFVDLTRTSSN
jgi:serine/threonine protein kinase